MSIYIPILLQVFTESYKLGPKAMKVCQNNTCSRDLGIPLIQFSIDHLSQDRYARLTLNS